MKSQLQGQVKHHRHSLQNPQSNLSVKRVKLRFFKFVNPIDLKITLKWHKNMKSKHPKRFWLVGWRITRIQMNLKYHIWLKSGTWTVSQRLCWLEILGIRFYEQVSGNANYCEKYDLEQETGDSGDKLGGVILTLTLDTCSDRKWIDNCLPRGDLGGEGTDWYGWRWWGEGW